MATQNQEPKTLVDDYTNASYVYICSTYELSALTSEAKWTIKRFNNTTGLTQYADGNDLPDNIADNRVGLTYV